MVSNSSCAETSDLLTVATEVFKGKARLRFRCQPLQAANNTKETQNILVHLQPLSLFYMVKFMENHSQIVEIHQTNHWLIRNKTTIFQQLNQEERNLCIDIHGGALVHYIQTFSKFIQCWLE